MSRATIAPAARSTMRASATDCTFETAMNPASSDPLGAEVLWFPARRTTVKGRACREYDVTNEAGVRLLGARIFLWDRDMLVTAPNAEPVFTIVRALTFPITGKAHVKELPSGVAIGTVYRNGTFRDSAGVVRGRFRDARSVRERTKESVLQGAMDAILATGADSMPSGPDALVLHIDGAIAGTLTYGALPFGALTQDAQPPARTIVPRFMQRMWQRLNAPRGWKFVRLQRGDDDARLQLAAALFAADLSRW